MYEDDLEAVKSALSARFELKRLLAVGGFSCVFSALDRASGSDVAVKVANRNSSEFVLSEHDVMAQLELLRTIDHPHILRIRDAGIHSGFVFLTMPLLAGPSLRDLLRQEPSLPITQVCDIVAQICRALGAAHRAGISHGNIRPSSLFLSQTEHNNNFVVVGGFERAVFHRAMMGEHNYVMGTPSPYMAPETLMAGRLNVAEPQADLWAVGVLTHELLTGNLPQRGLPGDLFLSRMLGDVRPLKFGANVPIELRDCVSALLRRNPSDRTSSAHTVALQLESVRQSHGGDRDWSYDVAISFAGEDRTLARSLAEALRERNVRVFYDEEHTAHMWGKNLADYLPEVYKRMARYCIILVSRHYATKAWPNHERRAALDRAISEFDREYILPIKLDGTSLPGIPESTAYVDAAAGLSVICDLIVRKLRHS